MKSIKIYTAGKMSGLSYDEQMSWRENFERIIKIRITKNIELIHPPRFYNYENRIHKNEREVKEWELNHLRDADIVVVNLDGINSSVGTHYELSFVDAINSFGNKHIYVIGIGNTDNLHPWINLSLFRVEHTIEDAVEYIATHLLI